MIINGINNLNQYAAMVAKQAHMQGKASKGTDKTDKKTDSRTAADTFQSSELEPYDPAKMDLATRKALAKGPLDEAELERRRIDRAYMRKVSTDDVRESMASSGRNVDSVERSKQNAAKFGPIQNKMLSGKLLTAEEKGFLRENYPELYTKAIQIEEEVKKLQNDLKTSKSKADKDNMFMQRKAMLLNNNKDSGMTLFMLPALDEAYRNMY